MNRPNVKDLSGQYFGEIFVIKRAENIVQKNGRQRLRFLCNCSCDRSVEFLVRGENLKNGSSTACWKCRSEKIGKSRFLNLEGRIFGFLKITSFYGRENRRTYWNANCDISLGGCGNNTVVWAGHLKRGHTTSCGCLRESSLASQLKAYFKKHYSSISEHKIVKNPKTKRWLKCDIYIPYGINVKINGVYIEVHGGQHFKFSRHWHRTIQNFEKSKERDKIKKKFARKNGLYIEIDVRKTKTIFQAIRKIEKILSKNNNYKKLLKERR